ncbi:excinuclease ABC subunit UvrB [Patescibacteria group bacterium]|nr:excinuclease ABC subunit UvrB [Patescibacteria group bacterium]
MKKFKLKSDYKPAGDQTEAIKSLVLGLKKGFDKQTLLGVTGSGKTFTMANVIEQTQMPTLVIAHNKTLAAQLCNEFREFFPENAVEYFVSYYDYYQPGAYMPGSDTYIEKEAQINEEIDRLRHACTQALLSRNDVIIVASVSCIYSLGSPVEYEKVVLHFENGQELDRRGMMERLIEMQFERTNSDLNRGKFRMRGQVFEIMPVNEERIYRFEISDKIESIEIIDPVTRKNVGRGSSRAARTISDVWIFPAKHYVLNPDSREKAFKEIKKDLKERLEYFENKGKVLEYERLKRKTNYDLEMIKNVGYCNGIENYSRYFDGREPGEVAFTLLDYFNSSRAKSRDLSKMTSSTLATLHVTPTTPSSKDPSTRPSGSVGINRQFLTIIDESHVTVPQIGGMYNGDRARKETLIEHGFRLPSAKDNRPLKFDEFEASVGPTIYTTATPGDFELKKSEQVVEQIVRPTGLVDPEVIVRPVSPTKKTKPRNSKSQIEDVIERIQGRIEMGDRTLVTTLTKKMAEDLTDYLKEKNIKVQYLHSDIKTMQRIQVINDLRIGKTDVIIGVNLLREGLDIPEVSFVAILDADKEGFLRSETSLIQTIGRAARNVNGQVILYADHITGSIERALRETDRRRKVQLAYNKEHGITPKTIEKSIKNILEQFGIDTEALKHKSTTARQTRRTLDLDLIGDDRPIGEIIKDKERKMRDAAKDLQFELAAILRDEVKELKKQEHKI